MNPTRRTVIQGLGAVGVGFGRQKPTYDLVILNGHVMDPETGLEGTFNVGIEGSAIAIITKHQIRGERTIDAEGMVVAPGFIDPIAHGQDLENDVLQAFDGVTTKLQLEVGVEDQDAFHRANEGKRILNFGSGCSHTLARAQVFGSRSDAVDAVATDAQIRQIAGTIERELRKGALGVGFGLEYQPASTRWEVIEAFRVAGRYGASCHVHARYGTMLEHEHVLTGFQEVIANAVVHGAPLHICHVPSMALADTPRALTFIERAQARKLDVTCDFYPYTAFGTGIQSEVFAPGWQERYRIDYKDLEWAKTGERLTAETFAKYRQEGGSVIAHAIPEAAVRAAVRSKATMVGSDGSLRDGVGHPRAAGTYGRIFGLYVRELEELSLMKALEKCTLRPARRLERRAPQFRRKGRLQVEMDADIVVFDSEKIIDRADYGKPALRTEGVGWLLVGGKPVIWEGRLIEAARPGKGIRGPRST